MTRALRHNGLLVAVAVASAAAGCKRHAPPSYAELANSEAVRVLKGDESPYRIIYAPPVNLAKPAPTSGPASPRRE